MEKTSKKKVSRGKYPMEIENSFVDVIDGTFHFYGYPFESNGMKGDTLYLRCKEHSTCKVKVKYINGKFYQNDCCHNHHPNSLRKLYKAVKDRIDKELEKHTPKRKNCR